MKPIHHSFWLFFLSTCYVTMATASPWPEANPDNVATATNRSITIEVLNNDIGKDLTLIAVNSTGTAGGAAQIGPDKLTVIYQPPTNFKGNDTFWYDFQDSEGRGNAAQVTVNVGADADIGERPVDWPVAVTDKANHENSDPLTLSVLENDIGANLFIKSVNIWSLNGGKISISADKKSLTYQTLIPQSEWPVSDEFWYVLEDGWGRTNSAKVNILLGYQTKPAAWPDAATDTAVVIKNQPTKINVLANDTGVGLSLKSVNTSSVKWGTISINGDKALYTPRYDFTGDDEFWYVFEDAWGRTNSAKVSLTVQAPSAISLNDTGARLCGDYAFDTSAQHNNDLSDCTAATDNDGDPIPVMQDATTGRDVTHNDDSDGIAGFSYTKLDANGQPLAAGAESWSCVKDNVSGLIWESKKGRGLGTGKAGLHGADDVYYSLKNNGGPFSTASCYGHSPDDPESYCHTDKFVNRVNAEALCGINNWRMPIITELESLVNYGDPLFAIDTHFFPETVRDGRYITSTSAAEDSLERLGISFNGGVMSSRPYYLGGHVRLVSDVARPAMP